MPSAKKTLYQRQLTVKKANYSFKEVLYYTEFLPRFKQSAVLKNK